jgi:hypothetical protein
MVPRSKEKSKVTETTEAPVEAATEDREAILAAAREEAQKIVETAHKQAELDARAAREEASALRAEAKSLAKADDQVLPEVPPPEPQPGTVVTPEPTVSAAARAGEAVGTTVDSTFPGIKVTNY